ncbi:MAG TPA: hypothetical protein VJA87_02195 [Candidatus Paceibacterota bacterium]
MTRETVLIILGVIVAASPYLGLPLSVLSVLLPILGLIVIIIAVMMRRTGQFSLLHRTSERVLPIHEAPEA